MGPVWVWYTTIPSLKSSPRDPMAGLGSQFENATNTSSLKHPDDIHIYHLCNVLNDLFSNFDILKYCTD